MESKYNRYISNKLKSLATLNNQDHAREGSLLWCYFDAPLMLLWWLGDGPEWIRRRLGVVRSSQRMFARQRSMINRFEILCLWTDESMFVFLGFKSPSPYHSFLKYTIA